MHYHGRITKVVKAWWTELMGPAVSLLNVRCEFISGIVYIADDSLHKISAALHLHFNLNGKDLESLEESTRILPHHHHNTLLSR